MSTPLRTLLVEDSEHDAQLLVRALQRDGYEPEVMRVDTSETMRAALSSRDWDLVLSDNSMPEFDALSALRLLRETGSNIPFIIVSGTMLDEQAVQALKLGATDYLLKDRLARLGPAVNQALSQHRQHQERQLAEATLRRTVEEQLALTQKLAEEKARLIAAQAVAKIGSWETDLASGTVVWSDETHRIFETDPQTFQPTHPAFLQLVHPDDRASVNKAFLDSPATREACAIEHRLQLPPDGHVKIVEERWLVFFDEHNQPVRAVGTCQDITECKRADAALRESEKRFRAIFDQAGVGMAMVSLGDGPILRCNRALADMLGYSEAELNTLTVQDVSEPEDYREDRSQGARMLAGEIARFQMEKRFLCKDGKLRWGLLTATLVRDDADQPSFIIGMVESIDERKKAETELRAAEEQLHALVNRLNTVREDESKRIARELHDDLGQRLTALNMELSGLEMNQPHAKPEHRRQIARMQSEVDITIELVQKISSELRLGPLDMLGLTAAIEWQANEFSRLSSIPVRILRLDELSGLTNDQSTNTFRIFQEALTNISRHAQASEVAVSLLAAPDHALLEVRDNGRGITPAEATDRRAIGLLGMRERAQLIGGAVAISGAPGKGTVVRVRLPLPSPPAGPT